MAGADVSALWTRSVWRTGLVAGSGVVLTWILTPVASRFPILCPLLGLLLASLVVLTWRTRRTGPEAWATGPAGIGLSLAGGACTLVLACGSHSPGCTSSFLAGWTIGLLTTTWKAARILPTPGQRLVNALRQFETGLGTCPVAGCTAAGLTCARPGCLRVLCGVHWIMADGRCSHCGMDHARHGPDGGFRHLAWTVGPIILATTAAGLWLWDIWASRGT
ncbi:MAG: hypothetical protein VKO21_00830 [Candidatus Sericytochromatia bacterium]|nr:hypothetical protein [Candidatus Sericytochromatia bacterium]